MNEVSASTVVDLIVIGALLLGLFRLLVLPGYQSRRDELVRRVKHSIEKSHKIRLLDFSVESEVSSNRARRFLLRKVKEHRSLWIEDEHDCYAVFRDAIDEATGGEQLLTG